jgi:hypothetical protein
MTSQRMELLATCDVAGRPDTLQIMLHQGHAFVSHPFTKGFSVIDIRDPRQPKPVTYVPPPPGTRTLHLQLSDGILLVTNEADNSASEKYLDKAKYFGQQLGQDTEGLDEFSAGVRVYDVTTPARITEIGFLPIPGFGTHRLWWAGGPLATASSMPLGYDDFILSVLDMTDPTKPQLIGHWAPENSDATGRMGLHHAILDGTVAYGAWRAGGLQIVDAAGGQLTHIGGLTPDRWGGGNTHTTLPLASKGMLVLADESVQDHQADGDRRIWLLDVTDKTSPKILGALPEPAEQDFKALGGVFGPHNLHENRPGTWQSEDLIFATYQNAGVRAYDITNAKEAVEVAYAVPPPPARNVDPRASGALVPQSADLIVTTEGLIIASDLNAGISLIQFEG